MTRSVDGTLLCRSTIGLSCLSQRLPYVLESTYVGFLCKFLKDCLGLLVASAELQKLRECGAATIGLGIIIDQQSVPRNLLSRQPSTYHPSSPRAHEDIFSSSYGTSRPFSQFYRDKVAGSSAKAHIRHDDITNGSITPALIRSAAFRFDVRTVVKRIR